MLFFFFFFLGKQLIQKYFMFWVAGLLLNENGVIFKILSAVGLDHFRFFPLVFWHLNKLFFMLDLSYF